MDRQGSTTPGQVASHIRLSKQSLIIPWSKNTQHRFQSQLYTYTPKSIHKIKKKQPFSTTLPPELIEACNIEIPHVRNEDEVQGEQKIDNKMKVESSEESEKMVKENEDGLKEQKEDKGDTKELTPLKVTSKSEGLIEKKIHFKEENESSDWTTQRKKKKKIIKQKGQIKNKRKQKKKSTRKQQKQTIEPLKKKERKPRGRKKAQQKTERIVIRLK